MAVDEHFLVGPHTSLGVIHVFLDHLDKILIPKLSQLLHFLVFYILGSIWTPPAFSVIKGKYIMNL